MCHDMLSYVPFLSFSGSECDAGHSVQITTLPTGGQFYNTILMFLTVREGTHTKGGTEYHSSVELALSILLVNQGLLKYFELKHLVLESTQYFLVQLRTFAMTNPSTSNGASQ